MNYLRRSLNAQLIFLGQAVVSGGNFITTVLMARSLSIIEFGTFSSIWLIILFSSSIVMALCVFPMMSNYHQLEINNRMRFIVGTLGTLIYAGVIWLLCCMVAYLILLTLDIKNATLLVLSTAICVIGINIQDFARRALITLDRPELALLSDVITYSLRVLGITVLWYSSNLNVVYALLICALTALAGASVLFLSVSINRNWNKDRLYSWDINRGSAKWLLPSGLMQWTSVNLFISAAAFLISPAAVGVIRLCQSLLAVLNVVVQSAESIVSLNASKIYKTALSKGLVNYLVKVSALGSIPFIFLSIICLFFGAEIITLVYGEQYAEISASALTIYSIAYIFVFLIVPIRAGLRTIAQTRTWFNAYLASTLFSVSVVYYFESSYGVYGAVLGIVLAHVVLIGYSSIALFSSLRKNF